MAIVFGNVEKPPIISMIVPKPGEGSGYNTVKPRTCLGVCDHITDGEGSIDWYYSFFATGGQRQYDALVDYIIDKSGQIACFNDPFGSRMPWASGGSDGLEGDGPAFVQARGVFGINGELASKEHIGKAPARMTDAQNEASAKLSAWLFDGASGHPRGSPVPWDSYPFNPNKGIGCVTALQHYEFATKPCPGAGIRDQTTEHQAFVRGLLKAAQTSVPPAPDPTPGKPTPPLHYPPGMTKAKAAAAFGKGELYRLKKPMGHFGYKESSPVCLAWLERSAKARIYPTALSWFQHGDPATAVKEIVCFDTGWVLWRPSSRASWAWLP